MYLCLQFFVNFVETSDSLLLVVSKKKLTRDSFDSSGVISSQILAWA